MEGFEVTKIGKHIFCILDAGNSSFYMIEGDEKAAVIDTGLPPIKKSCHCSVNSRTNHFFLWRLMRIWITYIIWMSLKKFICVTTKRK